MSQILTQTNMQFWFFLFYCFYIWSSRNEMVMKYSFIRHLTFQTSPGLIASASVVPHFYSVGALSVFLMLASSSPFCFSGVSLIRGSSSPGYNKNAVSTCWLNLIHVTAPCCVCVSNRHITITSMNGWTTNGISLWCKQLNSISKWHYHSL